MACNKATKEYKLIFPKDHVDEILKVNDDKTTQYIILQNNTLYSTLEELKNTLRLSNTKNQELEDDNDRLQTSKTYISSLAKNRYEIAEEYKIICKHQKEVIEYYKSLYSREFIKSSVIIVGYNCIITCILFFIVSSAEISYVKYLPYLLSFLLIFININDVKKNSNNDAKIKKTLESISDREIKIKKTEDANDYFHELVDTY